MSKISFGIIIMFCLKIKKKLKQLYNKDTLTETDVSYICKALEQSGSIEYTINRVHEHCEAARLAVAQIRDKRIRGMLISLTEVVETF